MIESRDPHLAGGEIMIFASGCAILTKVTYHMNLQDELILRNQGFVWEMFNVVGHIEINGTYLSTMEHMGHCRQLQL